jgi:hypothetical protein
VGGWSARAVLFGPSGPDQPDRRGALMSTRTTGHDPSTEPTSPMTHQGAAAYPLSWLLAVVTVAAGLPTIVFSDLLRGPAVMNGSARGTALVMVVGTVPLLITAMLMARRGSIRAIVLWLGAIAYLAYNAVMLLLGTPFNPLFLLYDAVLGLSIWAAITLLYRVDVDAFAAGFTPGLRVRWVAVFLWVVVLLNSLIWLRGIVDGMVADGTPAFLVGTGLTNLPTYIQDLAFWLPLVAVVAWWLWQARPWGFLLSASLLVYFVLEAVGVAVDQTWGHAADPASTVVSAEIAPLFLVLAVVCAVPLVHLLRHLERRDRNAAGD